MSLRRILTCLIVSAAFFPSPSPAEMGPKTSGAWLKTSALVEQHGAKHQPALTLEMDDVESRLIVIITRGNIKSTATVLRWTIPFARLNETVEVNPARGVAILRTTDQRAHMEGTRTEWRSGMIVENEVTLGNRSQIELPFPPARLNDLSRELGELISHYRANR